MTFEKQAFLGQKNRSGRSDTVFVHPRLVTFEKQAFLGQKNRSGRSDPSREGSLSVDNRAMDYAYLSVTNIGSCAAAKSSDKIELLRFPSHPC